MLFNEGQKNGISARVYAFKKENIKEAKAFIRKADKQNKVPKGN